MKQIKFIALLAIMAANIMFAGDVKKMENFKLKDYNGKEIQLSDLKDSKAVVIMFVATQCPVSNDYNERMAKIFNEYKDKGITFLGINSNKQESVEEIKKHAMENKFGFHVLKDVNNAIADKYGASVTPEVFVLNSKMELLYHGRIDDSRKADKVEVKDLSVALDEILAGKVVSNAKTKAFGCTIKRVN